MNFKVRCTHSEERGVDIGKIYVIRDHRILGANGEDCGWFPYEATKEGLNQYNYDQWDNAICKMSRFELVEEEKMFTKDDLRVGYVTKNRRGEFEMLMPTQNGVAIVGAADNGYLDGFKPDMTFGLNEYDIMEVYGYAETGCNALEVSNKNRPLLWQRTEITELTAEEAYKIIAEKKGVPVESVRVKWEG